MTFTLCWVKVSKRSKIDIWCKKLLPLKSNSSLRWTLKELDNWQVGCSLHLGVLVHSFCRYLPSCNPRLSDDHDAMRGIFFCQGHILLWRGTRACEGLAEGFLFFYMAVTVFFFGVVVMLQKELEGFLDIYLFAQLKMMFETTHGNAYDHI